MLNLIKYEFRKTLIAKLILLGLTVCLEGFFLYTVFSDNMNQATISVLLLIFAATMGVLFIGIHSVVTLHHDMNTKQSYMLFMTPHTNYAILGAKAIECTISVVLTALFFFGLGALDVNILFSKFGSIQSLVDFFKEITTQIGYSLQLDALSIAAFVIDVVFTWIGTIMVAFLADVIATALLKGKKYGGLVAFVFFIILSSLVSKITSLVPTLNSTMVDAFIHAGVAMAFAVAEYVGTATIMEKKLSV